MRVLLVDIGNSRVKWRFEDSRLGRSPQDIEDPGAVSPSGVLSLADLAQLPQRFRAAREPALDMVHLSNVAGADADAALRRAVHACWGDVAIHSVVPGAAQCGVRNGYRDPSQLGPDRWAAMLGAHALAPGRPLLVCSFGTATTIDLLLADVDDHRALFAGGLILPGFEAMRRALARDTARLPLVQGQMKGEIVDFALATDDAIASGIVAAQAGAVMRALRNARARVASKDRETGADRPLACLLAGGGANTMAASLHDAEAQVRVVPDLVLRGLHAIACDVQAGDETLQNCPPMLVREPS